MGQLLEHTICWEFLFWNQHDIFKTPMDISVPGSSFFFLKYFCKKRFV